ncbi:hypothetical protein GJV85_00725 [Sulfurimonas aquatica]|uniref:Type II secretion system protein K n=1 Tax=Sulfurimonas aquatica TaxID=2672570 RepID=A0A975GBI3_9BACT|nr:hypothetical protein [Sulfurimonas aquatica]QSZ40701.1 hypothetical protein GJV85_00725 [Sulfurimonas aquatica]
MQSKKNAIALLITIMFVIVITVAIGFSLKQINKASDEIKDESFMYQSSMLLEDILGVLRNSPELTSVADANSSEEFFIFLSQAGFIPLQSSGVELVIKIKSARSKFNPKNFNAHRADMMRQYCNNYMINSDYVDILVDNMSGIKADNSYNSAIFDENPYLFRDYIASSKHLQKINDFYEKEYNENSLKNINLDALFYFSDESNTSIDLNYATPEVWEMMLGIDRDRSILLNEMGGAYSSVDDLDLSPDEKLRLAEFKTSFFEPIVYVELEIRKDTSSSTIGFEYDIKTKKGSNFVYDI